MELKSKRGPHGVLHWEYFLNGHRVSKQGLFTNAGNFMCSYLQELLILYLVSMFGESKVCLSLKYPKNSS